MERCRGGRGVGEAVVERCRGGSGGERTAASRKKV